MKRAMDWLRPPLAGRCTAVARRLDRAYDRLIARVPPRPAGGIDMVRTSLRAQWGGPLNGQPHRQQIIRDLARTIDFDEVVETGRNRGSSAEFFAQVFRKPILTVEADPHFYEYSASRLANYPTVTVERGDSRAFLRRLASRGGNDRTTLFYLDAHWEEDLPLREEVEIVTGHWDRAVIVIDDFEVPGDTGHGFDDYGPGKRLSAEYLPELPGWTVAYPSIASMDETGTRRGCVILASPGLGPIITALPSLRSWLPSPSVKGVAPDNGVEKTVRYYKKDFWSKENLNYSRPHYRLEKSARIINRLARGQECTLLDVGCGPASLERLLSPCIQYFGIDIAIHTPAPNLIEADFLETTIRFGDRRFDIIVAQGLFEYVGDFQVQKLTEIAQCLNENGTFIASYVNFGHRNKEIYWPYNNVQTFDDFLKSLARSFKIRRYFPTSHNWRHHEPHRKVIRAANMHMNLNVPIISPILAVEYFFICSPHDSRSPEARP